MSVDESEQRRVEQAEGGSGPSEDATAQRCGLVAVLGAPNAGKSTLVNALVGQKVAIVSPKAQTTRARLMGIAIEDNTQMLLVDTPGIFTPNRRLDRAMVKAAWEGAEDADRVLLVVDAAAKVGARVEQVLEGVEQRREPLILVLNKVDIAKKEDLLLFATRLAERLKPEEIFMVSATTGDGVQDLKAALAKAMPAGPWHFPDDQLSDATDRMVAAELTREQLYLQLHAELPYSSAVETEKWEDRKDGSTVIHQQVLIERDSQKAIILGKGGSRLKQIGQAAREAIAEHLGRKVHLFLHVKVNPRWDEDRGLYKDIGLDWTE
jgi:GTP-binding protein Era